MKGWGRSTGPPIRILAASRLCASLSLPRATRRRVSSRRRDSRRAAEPRSMRGWGRSSWPTHQELRGFAASRAPDRPARPGQARTSASEPAFERPEGETPGIEPARALWEARTSGSEPAFERPEGETPGIEPARALWKARTSGSEPTWIVPRRSARLRNRPGSSHDERRGFGTDPDRPTTNGAASEPTRIVPRRSARLGTDPDRPTTIGAASEPHDTGATHPAGRRGSSSSSSR
jgi:hypothetical protein